MSGIHAHSVAYVRDTMLPQAEPPLTEQGVVKWLRENLFSSWINGALTIVTLYVIYVALSGFLPWAFGGVWNAGSLSECRAVLEAYGKSSHDAACWAVIQERWNQFLFGFYPQDLYWRPVLAFVLFFVALAPILFSERVPSSMLWFSGLYPFLAVWLIWGGSVWGPLFAMAGFAIGYLVYRFASEAIGATPALLVGVASAFVWWAYLAPTASDALHRMVATPKIASSQELLPAELEQISAGLDELEEQREALQAEIQELVASKEAVQEQIVSAREAGTSVEEDLAEFEEVRDRLAAVRSAERALSIEASNLSNRQTAVINLSNRVESIDELEENLPELRATAEELRNGLPDSVATLNTDQNLPPDISSEDAAALSDALAAENQVVNAEIAISETYQALGLFGLRPVQSNDLGGFLLSLLIGISGIVLSLPLGILLALGRQSDMFIINKTCVVFIEVIRGVPLIVWLFTASLLLNYFLPPGTNFDIMLRVIIMVTLFSAAYIAEVIRGGLAALPRGQYEAADALGLDYAKSMRLIVLPQALKISIPGIVNTFIGLFKDTTLVVFVGLFDPLKQMGDAIRADSDWTGIYWEVFIFPGIIFFLFCYGMGRYSMYLERKLQREHR